MRRWLFLLMAGVGSPALATPLSLDQVTIVQDATGMGTTGTLAADMLAGDLASLGAARPAVAGTLAACRATCIVIGRYDAPIIARVAQAGGIDLSTLAGQWERNIRARVRMEGRDAASDFALGLHCRAGKLGEPST